MTIEELLQKLTAITDAAETENRSLTDAEVADYEATETQLKAAQKTQELRSRTTAYVAPNASLAAVVNVGTAKDDDTEMRAFNAYLQSGGKPNADLEQRAQTVGTNTAGGYLVPDTLLAQIETRMRAYAGVEQEAYVERVDNGRTVKEPTNDDTANAAVPVSENTAPSSGGADLALGEIELETHTYTTSGAGQQHLTVSFQLIQDAVIDVQSWLVERIAERFGRGIANGFVNGTGSGEPFGITTNTTTTSTFTAATIDKDELISALFDVDPAYRQGGVWIFSDAALEQIWKLEDASGRPLWTPNAQAGLEGSIGGTLLGHPVRIDQAFAPYADGTTNRWGVFGNVRTGYWIRKVNGMSASGEH